MSSPAQLCKKELDEDLQNIHPSVGQRVNPEGQQKLQSVPLRSTARPVRWAAAR
jgi:hypothetical protein